MSKVSFDSITKLWNDSMSDFKRVHVYTLYGGTVRDKFIETSKIFNEYDEWKDVFSKVRGSKFLSGNNKRNWKASLVWVVNFDNFIRIVNGDFDDSQISDEMKEWLNA